MGSLYSVGMSHDAVQGIAGALGQLSAGDISGLNGTGYGNLLVMAANNAGLSLADILQKGLTSELKDIEEQIISAVNNGEFRVHNEGIISQNAKKVLVEKGYEVETGHQYNVQYYIIRW